MFEVYTFYGFWLLLRILICLTVTLSVTRLNNHWPQHKKWHPRINGRVNPETSCMQTKKTQSIHWLRCLRLSWDLETLKWTQTSKQWTGFPIARPGRWETPKQSDHFLGVCLCEDAPFCFLKSSRHFSGGVCASWGGASINMLLVTIRACVLSTRYNNNTLLVWICQHTRKQL